MVIIDELLNAFLDQLPRWSELAFENFYQFCLQLRIRNAFSHLHYLHDSLLHKGSRERTRSADVRTTIQVKEIIHIHIYLSAEFTKYSDFLMVLFGSFLARQLETSDEVDSTTFL